MPVNHLYSFFGKMSVQVFCPLFDLRCRFLFFFLQGVSSGVFLCVVYELFVLAINPLSVILFANIFLPFCWLSLQFVDFPVQKALN